MLSTHATLHPPTQAQAKTGGARWVIHTYLDEILTANEIQLFGDGFADTKEALRGLLNPSPA